MTTRALTALAACVALLGCQLVLGLEERSEREETSDASAPTHDAAADATSPTPADAGCVTPAVSCDGVCADLQGDGQHCGACHHACLGAVCARGECVPEKLADVAYGLIAAVDADEIFYRPTLYETMTGPLLARSKTTGAERIVVPDLGRWYVAEIVGDELVVVENGPRPRVRRIHRQSGRATLLYEQASQSPPFQYLATDGDTIYFTTKSDLRRIKLDGSGYAIVRTIDDGPNGAGVIAITDTQILYGVADSANLYALDKTSPFAPPSIVGAGGAPISTLTVIGGEVAWTSGPLLHVLPVTGATTTPYASLHDAHSAASRDGVLYLYDVEFGTRNNRVLRFDAKTQSMLVLASGIQDGRLAVDDTYVYFANYAGGLYRVPR